MRVAVVGLGAAGSAACWNLAKGGHSVVGFEQFRVGNDRGSSYGESRAIRYGYADAFYTRLMKQAYACWDELEAQAQEPLRVRCGSLFFGREKGAFFQKSLQALQSEGIPFEVLDKVEVEKRFPAFRLASGDAKGSGPEIACFQPDGGFLRATRCVLALIRLAKAHGAEIRERTPVHKVTLRNGLPLIHTDRGQEAFDAAIITAGPWMKVLLQELSLPLEVTRQQVVYLRIAQHPERFLPSVFPVWIDTDRLIYGFPQDGVIQGVKIADHNLGERVDPNQVNREVDPSTILEMSAYALKRFPDLDDKVTHTQVCLYTNTPNEDFILDTLPNTPTVALVSGCSGHGFKFTVLLGKWAAHLVTSGERPPELHRFALSCFLKKHPSN